MRRYQNVFEEIVCEGHEESFVPVENDEFEPTDFPADSCEKRSDCYDGGSLGLQRSGRHDTATLMIVA